MISLNSQLFINIINEHKPFFDSHKFLDYFPVELTNNQIKTCNDIEKLQEEIEVVITLTRKSEIQLDKDIYHTLVSIKGYIEYFLGINTFQEFVGSIYGVSINYVEESTIEKKKKKINQFINDLGYTRKWPQNYLQWKSSDECNHKFFECELVKSIEIGSQYTRNIIIPTILKKYDKLTPPENFFDYNLNTIDTKEKWKAYCCFDRKKGISILLNKNILFYKSQSYMIAFHELFPGHAFEIQLREHLFDNGLLDAFYTIQLLGVPRTLIHEGLATYLPQYFNSQATLEQRISILENSLLNDSRHNVGLKLLNKNLSKEEAIKELMIGGMRKEKEAKDSLEFCINWPRYFLSYSSGVNVVKKALKKKNPWHNLYLNNHLS